MADESIKELIVDNITDAIREIQITNGYANTLETRTVVRGRETPGANISPIVMVFEGADIKNTTPESEFGSEIINHRSLSIVVDLYVSTRENLTTKLNSLEADIIKAVMVDQTRGGYATTTSFEESMPGFDVEDKAIGGRELTFHVSYTMIETDPYRQ
jgi:hypothetical protein